MAYEGRVSSDNNIEMVWELLKAEADNDGVTTFSFEYVAEKLGIEDAIVSRAVDHLVNRGFIEERERNRTHTTILLNT